MNKLTKKLILEKWDENVCIELDQDRCRKAIVAVYDDDGSLTVFLAQSVYNHNFFDRYNEIARLPSLWFYVYDHETAENYYAVFLDKNTVAVHEDIYHLMKLLKKKGVFYYVSYYEDYIAYLLKRLSEYIETDEFQKKYGIDLRKCKPLCILKKDKGTSLTNFL